MAKKMKKTLSMILVLCMMVSMMAVPAFAAEPVVETEEIEGGQITTTTTTETDENGNVTVNVIIEEKTVVTDDEGKTVTTSEVTEETTVTNANNEQTMNSWVVDGSETTEWTEEVTPEDTELPEVNVSVEPGKETESEKVQETKTEITGDIPEGSDDTEYDYTETETTISREVTVEASDVTVTVDDVSSDMTSAEFDDYEGKQDVVETLDSDEYLIQETEGESHDGYDHQYVGYVEAGTRGFPCVKVVYQRDDDGNLITDAEGKPVIDHFEDFFNGTFKKDGEPITDFETLKNYYITSPTTVLFCLQKGSEEDFKNVYAYCCDLEIDPIDGTWYTVANLEDSDYYASEESEAHIRGIASNGYWGVSNEPDENGEFKRGSIAKIKADMKAALENGEIENVLVETKIDADGNEVKVYLSDVIDDLTEGEALNATQAAIWSYSNGSTSVQNPKDGFVVLDPAYGQKPADAARITALYNWLMNQTAEKEVTVINDKNFVEDVSLVVGDQVAETASNADADKNNDVYHTAMNFKLAFVPGENDDLLVYLQYKDLDGNDVSIVKRLAGTNTGDDAYETIVPDENGNYMIKGLKLRENEDFKFDLNLQGTQYLVQGVYIYTAGGREASQTFVSYAEGNRSVDVSMGMTISFNVDEEKNIVAQRVWHTEGDPAVEPVAEPAAGVFAIPARPLDNIPDEEVPLADAPQTGDEVVFFAVLTVLAGISLMAMHVSEQKRKEEV